MGWNASGNAMRVMLALGKIEEEAKSDSAQAIYNLGAEILRSAKENAPVKTGALRRSGRLKRLRGAGRNYVKIMVSFGGMGTGVDYAYMAEVGSQNNPAHFYLLKAVRKHSPALKKMGLKAFENAWDKEAKKVKAGLGRLV